MAGGDRLFRPRAGSVRDPLSNTQNNGRVVNTPRYAQMGGLTSAKKAAAKNGMSIKTPGDTVKG